MSGASILIIDDDVGICQMVGDFLGLKGYAVETATSGGAGLEKLRARTFDAGVETAGSGREALEILGRSAVDVVVLDVRMPEMPGMVVWAEIKRIKPELARRTVFCTGDVVGEEVRSFLHSTGCQAISKPFDLSYLFDAVARAAAR